MDSNVKRLVKETNKILQKPSKHLEIKATLTAVFLVVVIYAIEIILLYYLFDPLISDFLKSDLLKSDLSIEYFAWIGLICLILFWKPRGLHNYSIISCMVLLPLRIGQDIIRKQRKNDDEVYY